MPGLSTSLTQESVSLRRSLSASSSWFVHTSDKTEPTRSAGYASDWEYAPIDGYANFHRLRARMVLAPLETRPRQRYAYTNGIEW